MLLQALIFALFGAIIGSFLNVLVLRRGVKSLGGRSGCASCDHELEALDLVPIISYLVLRGRCRFCGSRISIQYPLVEATSAILFGCIGAAPITLELQILALPIVALLVAIAAYDILHGIIPDTWVYALSAWAFLFTLAYLNWSGDTPVFVGYVLAGPAAALPFAALWFVSGGRWMGLGDAKLAWSIGWLLGPLYALIAITFAFVLGAFISVCILLPLSSPRFLSFVGKVIQHRAWQVSGAGYTMKSEVAFGPFLAAGCIVIWLLLLFGHDPLAYLGLVSL